jgi:hypothetical protein
MRMLFGGLLPAALLALVAAAPVAADHSAVSATVEVWRGTTLVADSMGQDACTGNECTVTVQTDKQSYSRFLRWCGSDRVTVRVNVGGEIATSACAGGGPWRVQFTAYLLEADMTHDGFVDVTVVVTQAN